MNNEGQSEDKQQSNTNTGSTTEDLSTFGLPLNFAGVSNPPSNHRQRGKERGRGRAEPYPMQSRSDNHQQRDRGRGRGRANFRGRGGEGFDRGRGRPRGGGGAHQGSSSHIGHNPNEDDPSLHTQRPVKAFFKPSFLENPWAHLES
ncbi:unnamed protein product [Sympodiomycopsis kandeliae]